MLISIKKYVVPHILGGGRMIVEGTPNEVLASAEVQAVCLGENFRIRRSASRRSAEPSTTKRSSGPSAASAGPIERRIGERLRTSRRDIARPACRTLDLLRYCFPGQFHTHQIRDAVRSR